MRLALECAVRRAGQDARERCIALRIHAGLFPPATTSVGTVAAVHRVNGSGLPRWLSETIVRSHGSVCATPLSFDHAGMNRIKAMKTAGTPTIS